MRQLFTGKTEFRHQTAVIGAGFAGPVRLCLDHFSGLDATGADANALAGRIDFGLHRLQVDIPAAPRDVVRVRDVIAELRLFAANFTYLCHKPLS